MSQFHRTEREVIQAAHALGLIAVFPRDDELMLDIDRPYCGQIAELVNKENWDIMLERIKVKSFLITRSKSGNAHIYVWIDRVLDEFSRVALQACLGSDSKREILSWMRRADGEGAATTCCFETEQEFDRIVRWRTPLSNSWRLSPLGKWTGTKAHSIYRDSFGEVEPASTWSPLTGKDR